MNTLKVLSAFCLLAPTLAQANFNAVQCDITNGSGDIYGSLNIRFFGPEITQQYTGHSCSPTAIPTVYNTEHTETSLTLKLNGGNETFSVAHHRFRAYPGCVDMTDTITIPREARLSIPIGPDDGVAEIFANLTFSNNLIQHERDFVPRRIKIRAFGTDEQHLKIQNCVYSN
jgi:hypothetical protein